MAGKEPDYGSTAMTVAANVQRLREGQNLTYTQVSERLDTVGWPLTPVAVRRIENVQRRVTADDLVAIAVALGVSPITLLMPKTEAPSDSAEVTGVSGRAAADRLWQWLAAEHPLTGDTADVVFGFIYRSIPAWLLGTKVDLVEYGLEPNIKRSVRRHGTEQMLEELADGDDQ